MGNNPLIPFPLDPCWLHRTTAGSSSIARIDIYVFAPQACWAVIGVARSGYHLPTLLTHKIFRTFYEGHCTVMVMSFEASLADTRESVGIHTSWNRKVPAVPAVAVYELALPSLRSTRLEPVPSKSRHADVAETFTAAQMIEKLRPAETASGCTTEIMGLVMLVVLVVPVLVPVLVTVGVVGVVPVVPVLVVPRDAPPEFPPLPEMFLNRLLNKLENGELPVPYVGYPLLE